MTIFYKDRLRSDKIYQLEKLLVRTKPNGKVSNEACLVMSPDATVDSFVDTSNRIAFYPNAVKKVYFPNEKILLPAFTKVKNNSIRDSNFNELKSFRYNFNKLLDVTKLPEQFLQKPILIDTSVYRDTLNKFAFKNRKTPIALIGIFTKILEDINEMSPSVLPSFLLIEINAQHDTFLAVMRQAIMSKPAAIMPLLAKLNILFVTHNGYYFKPDFSSIKDRAKILNLLRKLTDIATDPNTATDKSGDIVVPKDSEEPLSDDELNAVRKPNEVEHDINDKEQTELHSDIVHDNDDTPLEEPEDSLVDDEDETSDESDEDSSDATGSRADSSVDLNDNDADSEIVDDILGGETSVVMGSTEIEMERIRKENEEFLAKNMEKQTKALKDLEEEADRLAKDKNIDPLIIDDDSIISKTVKSTTLTGITKSYYQKQFKRDVLNSVKVLNNDPEFPVVITKMEIINKSTPLSKLDEYRIEFLDKKYKRHSFIVDVPKLSHDGFLLINGSRKFIAKQATPVPVIKETHDRVQITTNYRKTFLYRKGDKTSGQADRVLRLLTNFDFKSITKSLGNSVASNMAFQVSIPYNYLAKKLYSVKFVNSASDVELLFNQETLRKTIESETKFKFDEKKFSPIGFQTTNGKRTKLLLEEISTRKIHSSGVGDKPIVIADSLVAFLTHLVTNSKDEEIAEAFKTLKPSLKLSYTEIKIVSTSMALGVLIATYKGLLPFLDLYKVKYRVEEKRVAKKDSEIILAFKDVYLYIDSENDPAKEILVNGLLFLSSASYSINDTYTFAPIYLDYLQEATGSRNTAKALSNFEHSMIDPITLENLIKLNFPTNFPELLLYGNSLLGELTHNRKNDMNHFRIRDSEVLSVAIYNTLMDSFNNYKRSMRSGVVQPISAKRDTVIKTVQSLENVEDYSTLNPFLEAEVKSKTTFKGPSGLTNYSSH